MNPVRPYQLPSMLKKRVLGLGLSNASLNKFSTNDSPSDVVVHCGRGWGP